MGLEDAFQDVRGKYHRNVPCLIMHQYWASEIVWAISFLQEFKLKNRDKIWLKQILEIPEWPRKKSVELFHLISGYDCFRKHLHRINVSFDSLCPLCYLKEEMDLPHLYRCPVLPRVPIWECYWAARNALSKNMNLYSLAPCS